MLKYSFIGDKEKIKSRTEDFLKATRVNELMLVSNMYSLQDRIESFSIFSQVMKSI